MLSLDVTKLMREIESQTRARDEKLQGIALLLERYPGNWWRSGGVRNNESGSFDPENAAFEYVAYLMAQLVWDNPRWRVTTKRGRAQQMVAEAMHWQMNRWSADTDIKTVLADLAMDYSFAWGVAHTTLRPRVESYEAEDPILSPQVSRISPWDFGFDHRAPTWRRARMLWHRYKIDKDDLIEQAERDRELPREKREGWKLDAIESLNTSDVPENWMQAYTGQKADNADREEVEMIEVYLPGHRLPNKPGPEEGFNGTCLTLGVSGSSRDRQGATMVRPPRPFFGPRWGPYTVLGCYVVPDSPYPLSLLAATAGHIEQTTRIAQAVDRQVETYKRLGLVSAIDAQLADTIKNGKNDTVYQTNNPNLQGAFIQQEVGGTTPGNVAAYQMRVARRDRIMGFSANERGSTTGDTATDVTYANEAAEGRQGWVRGRFADGVRRIGYTVAWYNFYTDEIVSALGPDAAEAFNLPEDEEAWFVGGHFDDGSGTTFDDLGLEIEPGSMERPTEAKLAMQSQALLQALQMVPAFPAIAQVGGDVKGILDAFGDGFGMSKLSRFFPGLDSVDLASIQPAEAEPRFSKDVGIRGLLKGFKAGAQGGGMKPPESAAFGQPQPVAS